MIPKVSEKLFLPTQSEHFLFQLRPASDYTFVEKEELIYPLTSLVAEVLVIIIMVMVIMVMVIMVMVIMVMVMVVLVMVIISIFFVSLPRRPGAAYIIFLRLYLGGRHLQSLPRLLFHHHLGWMLSPSLPLQFSFYQNISPLKMISYLKTFLL